MMKAVKSWSVRLLVCLFLSSALLINTALAADTTSCPLGGCTDANPCCCLAEHIKNNDGENAPDWFSDSDPNDGKSEPADYKMEVIAHDQDIEKIKAELDPNESAITGVMDLWDMTRSEILEEEYKKLPIGTRWFYDYLLENNGQAPQRIPTTGQDHNGNEVKDLLDALRNAGLLINTEIFCGSNQPVFSMGPKYKGDRGSWWVLQLGTKTCFYTGIHWEGTGTTVNPFSEFLNLRTCVPKTWKENSSYQEKIDALTTAPWSTNALDLAVSLTPFLGTADTVVQDWDKLKNFDPDAIANTCGNALADAFVFAKCAKALKLIKDLDRFDKFANVVSFVTGAGSVTIGAVRAFRNTDQLPAERLLGARIETGLQLLALLTDQSVLDILKPHFKRTLVRSKIPKAMATCNRWCGRATEVVQIARQPLEELFQASRRPFTQPVEKLSLPPHIRPLVFAFDDEDYRYIPWNGSPALIENAFTGQVENVFDALEDFLKKLPVDKWNPSQIKKFKLYDSRDPTNKTWWTFFAWGDAGTQERIFGPGFPPGKLKSMYSAQHFIDRLSCAGISTTADDWILLEYTTPGPSGPSGPSRPLAYHFAYNRTYKFRILHYEEGDRPQTP